MAIGRNLRLAAHVAAVCALTSGVATAQSTPAKFQEAPALAERAKTGQIPAVADRLPKQPRVIAPIEGIGRYGGVWRTAARGRAETWTLRTLGYDHLFHWKPDWSGVMANVALKAEANADATEYLIHLREGMRWSDGQPFTADDLVFAYEHVFKRRDLGGMPAVMQTQKGPGVLEKLSDTSVRVRFPQPNAMFLEAIAQVTTATGADPFTKYPAHYMRRYHQAFNADGLAALVQQAGVRSWMELFEQRSDTWLNAEKPTLNAWVITTPYGRGTRMVGERNPYYFKVDSAGNQLPYIDRVVYEIVQDDQVLLLKAIAGELDMHAAHINDVENRAVLTDNQARGNFRFFDLLPSEAADTAIMLNMTHRDPTLRKIFGERDFRVALSIGFDRKVILDQVFVSEGFITQPAIRPDFPLLYDERLAKQHTEFDQAAANKLLDGLGFQRGANGIRQGPDGKPIRFSILVRNDKKFMIDTIELVVHYWKQLGLDVSMDVAERSLVRQRMFGNQHDVSIEDLPGGKQDVFLRPQQLLPMHHNATYGISWVWWYLGRDGAEEPPPSVRRQFDLWARINATNDQDKRVADMREIIKIAAENFFLMGVSAPRNQYGIVSNRMRNVPKAMEGSYWFAYPGPTDPPTYSYGLATGG
jgi:peptide/nickel transport system substrate-binding protein